MRKLLIILFLFLLLPFISFAADITDNINNYIFGQTVTLDHVIFNFPTNTPVNGYSLRIDGIGTATTNYYWDVSSSGGGDMYLASNNVVTGG